MQNNKLLSICILTYNRPLLVKKTLLKFIDECKNYNITIFISDNSNNNETEKIVFELKKIYPYIEYKLNKENLGFDGNVISAIEMSDTKYCWLFGDDDLIEENAIGKILEILTEDYGLVIINSSTHNTDFSKIITKQHWKIDQDKYYSNLQIEKSFSDLVLYTSFVGCMIIKKELWKAIKFEKYLKTGFVHVGVAFEYLINSNLYYISDPLIKIRLGNSGWSKNSFQIWYVNWVSVIQQIPFYSDDVKKNVIKTPNSYNIKFLLAERAKKYYTKNQYFEIIKKSKEITWFKKKIYYIIAISPVYPWKIMLMLYLLLFKPNLYEYQLYELNINSKETEYI